MLHALSMRTIGGYQEPINLFQLFHIRCLWSHMRASSCVVRSRFNFFSGKNRLLRGVPESFCHCFFYFHFPLDLLQVTWRRDFFDTITFIPFPTPYKTDIIWFMWSSVYLTRSTGQQVKVVGHLRLLLIKKYYMSM